MTAKKTQSNPGVSHKPLDINEANIRIEPKTAQPSELNNDDQFSELPSPADAKEGSMNGSLKPTSKTNGDVTSMDDRVSNSTIPSPTKVEAYAMVLQADNTHIEVEEKLEKYR